MLLDAFEQDICATAAGHWPYMQSELNAYATRSANPIGRLLLHLYGESRPAMLHASDALCTALQLINFWQDLSQDISRGRYYLPLQILHAHGVSQADILLRIDTPKTQAAIAACCAYAKQMIDTAVPLSLGLPGRLGWEAAVVIQGGLRILEKIAQLEYRTLRHRPRISRGDMPLLLWRAVQQRWKNTFL
jgi:phytoene/squalene synthetase